MADKAISDLIQALQITGEDLFVLEQNGEAKKLKGKTLLDFITLNVVSVTVTTLPAGSSATATYDTSTNTLALGIPQGKKGDTGATGATGPANTLKIGTVTSGSEAGATIAGTAPNQTLNLVLPKGDKGDIGPTGPQGPQGVQGEPGPQVSVDDTLTKDGDAADAKATGEAISQIKDDLEYALGGVQFQVKDSLLVAKQVDLKNLDAVALSGKTYREIFVAANRSIYRDFESITTADLNIAGGNPVVTDEESYTGRRSLKCFGVGSLVKETFAGLQKGHSLYCALKMRVDHFTSGSGAGLQLYSLNQTVNARNSTPSLKYSTISAINNIGDNTGLNAFLGVFGSGNANAYIDNIVVIDLNDVFGADIPDKTSLDEAYNMFSEIVRGIDFSVRQKKEHSNEDCYHAFVAYMNEKALELGINTGENGSYFDDASGLSDSSRVTPLDSLTLCMSAINSEKIARIMCTKEKVIHVHNSNAVIKHDLLTDDGLISLFGDYKMLGGKGGSLIYSDRSEYFRSNIMFFNIDGHTVITSMMCNTQRSFNILYEGLKELCDIVHYDICGGSRPSTPNLDIIIEDGGGYCGIVLKEQSDIYSVDFLIGSPFYISEKVSESTSFAPASVTKVLTALAALDWIQDFNAYITVDNCDLASEVSSAITFQNGDKIRVKDCLYLMLLRSNNTMANALARTVGQTILS